MDFSKMDTSKTSDEGAWVDLISPDGTAVVAKFKVAGRDSKIIKKRQQAIAKKKAARKNYTPSEEDNDLMVTIAHATLDWISLDEDGNEEGHFILVDEKKLECTYDNAFAFYQRFTWAAEQIIQEVADRSNFLQK